MQVLDAQAHWTVRTPLRQRADLSDPVVDGGLEALLPPRPVDGGALDQLHVRLVVGVCPAPYHLGYVGRARVRRGDRAAFEHHNLVATLGKLDGRGDSEHARTDDAGLHIQIPPGGHIQNPPGGMLAERVWA